MKNDDQKNWPKDEFGRQEVEQFVWWIGFILLVVFALWWSANLRAKRQAGSAPSETVIVYCAQDQTYAEPILREFEQETSIRVKAVYDSEAVKTVGLANRLLAERNHPQCDVFWGNEEMRTRQLATFDVWRETNGFVSFGSRVRCLVINTNLLQPGDGSVGTRSTASQTEKKISGTQWIASLPGIPPVPTSLLDLTNRVWRGRVAIAFPQFGTTATHFHVLRQHWGDELWQQWCRGLVANDTRIMDGNSTVVKMVGRGEAWIGLTDTDDVAAGQRDGLPVVRGPALLETLLFIPNTVGIVRGAPHPDNAQNLADYLRQPQTVERLLDAGAIQYAEVPAPGRTVLEPEWEQLLRDLESTTETLNGIFLR